MPQSKHPLYKCWINMKRRCNNPSEPSYRWYGERGITVCDEWFFDFWQFVEDMGPKPSCRHSIDRIDNDGNYEPGNCRWATLQQQADNQRKPAVFTGI